jgi:hypothetical protein
MNALRPSGHQDLFARESLPPRAQWPDLLAPPHGLSYPDRLNAADALLDCSDTGHLFVSHSALRLLIHLGHNALLRCTHLRTLHLLGLQCHAGQVADARHPLALVDLLV